MPMQVQPNWWAFCINGEKKAKFSELFLSHPPLDKRIEALRNQSYID